MQELLRYYYLNSFGHRCKCIYRCFSLFAIDVYNRANDVCSSAPEFCTTGDQTRQTQSFSACVSTWARTQPSMHAVLEHLKAGRTAGDVALDGQVNRKFLTFHRDVTEECGARDKQHSWAIIEKQEELVIYGPFYPNYSSGQHSEDVIIKQTQELLESDAVAPDWKIYIFTLNSPCLARNSEPCMLNLVRKAHEWWSLYRVRTHIGFVKCWGFKGNKETLFKDVNYSQIQLVIKSENHQSYVEEAEKKPDLDPLCENLFSAMKEALKSVRFPPVNIEQGTDWRSYFKSVLSILPEDENFTQDVDGFLKEAQALLSRSSGSLQQCVEEGETFALGCSFSAQVSDAVASQARLAFQQCWREAVQDKYAESVRERLTEAFNQCTVHMFIKAVAKFTKHFLQIGKICFQDAHLTD